jgi:predicted dehydrogenase
MPLRIIQVGLGGWGRDWYASVLRADPRVEVVALVDGDEGALRTARTEHSVEPSRCWRSLDDALGKVRADAVLVTASLPGHGPICRAALQAGFHVLVEKPFVPTVKEARALAALAERRKRVLMVSQNYRFHPAVRAVQKAIRDGRLGAVATVAVDFRRHVNGAKGVRRHYDMVEPLLLDMAVHQMDLLRAVLGREAKEVLCWSANPAWSKYRDSPLATALVRFDGDVAASYRGSWIAHHAETPWAGLWTIECERGAVVWTSRGSDADERVWIHRAGAEPAEVALPRLRHTDRAGCLDAFITSVTKGVEPETSARDNVNTVLIVSALIASAKTRRAVRLSGGANGK